MSRVSSDVIWGIVQNHNSFLRVRCRSGPKFSVEPLNINGIHSKRFTGIGNRKAVTLALSKKKDGVVLKRASARVNKPRKSILKTVHKSHYRANVKAITNICKAHHLPRSHRHALRARLHLFSQKIRPVQRKEKKKLTKEEAKARKQKLKEARANKAVKKAQKAQK